MECGTDLVDMRAMAADGLVQRVAGNPELLGPVRDIRGQLGVDHLGIVGSLGVFFLDGVRGVLFGFVVVFGQVIFPFVLP